MEKKSKYDKEALTRLIIETSDAVSATPEKAAAYLREQGIDPESVLEDGKKRLAQIQKEIAEAKKKKANRHRL